MLFLLHARIMGMFSIERAWVSYILPLCLLIALPMVNKDGINNECFVRNLNPLAVAKMNQWAKKK